MRSKSECFEEIDFLNTVYRFKDCAIWQRSEFSNACIQIDH